MKINTKYYYIFQPTLNKHLQFYIGWVNEARNRGIPIRLLTFYPLQRYIKDIKKIIKLTKGENAIIVPVLPGFKKITMTIFFLTQRCFSNNIVVHLRKVDSKPFAFLKRLLKNFRVIIDLEGDPASERDYLLNHPYKPNFYNNRVRSYEKNVTRLKEDLSICDTAICVNDQLKKLLSNRHPEFASKFRVLPTGVDTHRFYFDLKERNKIRKDLNIEGKLVFVFCGSLYYSWQNISTTLNFFKTIKNRYKNAYFILLTSKADFPIAEEFIKKYDISCNDLLLRNVPNEEVRGFLNASDIGVLLRHDHIMNRVASPGKIGEYVACGLTLLTTRATTIHSDILEKTGQAILIEDMDDNNEFVEKIDEYVKQIKNRENELKRRREFIKENVRFYSNSDYGELYFHILKNK